jgi:cation transport regulator ChaC
MTSLNKTASWVIVDKTNNKAIHETYSYEFANMINKAKYEAVPILEYLQNFNKGLKQ